MAKRLCAIQASASDITDGLAEHNSVLKLKRSELFDEVVLVAPDIPSTDKLAEYADLWDVPLFRGAPQNVAQRYVDCAAEYAADVVCRCLPQSFYLDVALIQNLLEEIERTHVDYLLLPRDFDLRFGADVTSAGFFQRVLDLHGKEDPAKLFNPWGLAEIYSDKLELGAFDNVPEYSNECLASMRELMTRVWPEHWDSSYAPMFPYKYVASLVEPAPDRATRGLDLACGFGMGTQFLYEQGFAMTGVDIVDEVIERAQAQFGSEAGPGPRFVAADYGNLDLESCSLDFVVSIHTMEHVQDDRHFLESIHNWMKDDAVAVIEVPLLYNRPFSGSDDPWNPFHIREYKIDDLLSLIAERFRVVDVKGVSRGSYVSVDNARNAAMVIAQKTG